MPINRKAYAIVIFCLLLQQACKKPVPVPEPIVAQEAVVDMKVAEEAEAKLKLADEVRKKSELEFQEAKVKAMSNIYFEYDKSAIRDEDKDSLQGLASFLIKYPQIKIQISGHADERGTNEYNLALGNKRASATLSYLKSLGIEESRLQSISFGKEKPLCTESNESCWSQNRRAEFIAIN